MHNAALARASTALLLARPFVGHVLCGLERRLVPGPTSGIIVDSGRFVLLIGADAFRELSAPQQRGLLLHHLLHLLLRHPQRQQAREPGRWRLACDVVVGPLLAPEERGPNERLPADLDLPPDQSAEFVYDQLPAHSADVPDTPMPWSLLCDSAESALAHERFGALVSSAFARRGPPGTLPGGLWRTLSQWLGAPTVPWTAHIRRFEARARHGERKSTLHRRSRRYGTVPGLRTADQCRLVVVLDTSASISPEALGRFAAELRQLRATGTSLHVVFCDAAVHDQMPFSGALPDHVPGGGGTDLEPGLIAALEHNPDGVILFTDGHLPSLRTRSPCPLLWVLTPDGQSDATRQGSEVRLPA